MRGRPDKIDPRDLKFVPVDPEPGFDPEHNRRVIEKTIRWTDAMAKRKEREVADGIGERTSAFAKYTSAVNQGKTGANVEKYFGKRFLAYLKGKYIIEEMKKRANV